MFTNLGFLGTEALLYMDIVTIYFAIFPFLLLRSIYFAIKKEYKKHFVSQSIILAITIIMVLIFEIGVRLTGGFESFAKNSSIPYDFLLSFLLIHIIVAIASLSGWLYQFSSSYKLYKSNNLNALKSKKHKKIGKAIFFALLVNSIMGICIYLFLFIF